MVRKLKTLFLYLSSCSVVQPISSAHQYEFSINAMANSGDASKSRTSPPAFPWFLHIHTYITRVSFTVGTRQSAGSALTRATDPGWHGQFFHPHDQGARSPSCCRWQGSRGLAVASLPPRPSQLGVWISFSCSDLMALARANENISNVVIIHPLGWQLSFC